MNKKLNILFCSSEVTPFSKTGGLGDVAGSLPKALAEIGCQVRVIAPQYACVSNISAELKKVTDSVNLRIGGRNEGCGLYEGRLPHSDVPVYFVSDDKYFNRKGIYQEDGEDYKDNLERFSFLSIAMTGRRRLFRFI